MFNTGSGIWFERLSNGDVVIEKRRGRGGAEDPIESRTVIPATTWARTVVAVSALGGKVEGRDAREVRVLKTHNEVEQKYRFIGYGGRLNPAAPGRA